MLACCYLNGQSKRTNNLSPSEERLLELIRSDSISATICYLPQTCSFGIGIPQAGQLILVKKGPRNLFLLEGTHRVYIPDSIKGGGLRRIESTLFAGDNFEPWS